MYVHEYCTPYLTVDDLLHREVPLCSGTNVTLRVHPFPSSPHIQGAKSNSALSPRTVGPGMISETPTDQIIRYDDRQVCYRVTTVSSSFLFQYLSRRVYHAGGRIATSKSGKVTPDQPAQPNLTWSTKVPVTRTALVSPATVTAHHFRGTYYTRQMICADRYLILILKSSLCSDQSSLRVGLCIFPRETGRATTILMDTIKLCSCSISLI
jgi:hypothetical protein